MKRMLDLWSRFWFQPIAPHLCALVRIVWGVLGLLCLYAVGDVDLFWRLDGLVAPPQPRMHELLASVVGAEWAPMTAVVLITLAYLAMIAGILTPLAVPVAFLATLAQIRWNPLPLSSLYQVYLNLLFCVALMDSGRVWSVDAWIQRRRGRVAAEAVPLWPLRLFRFQVCVIYGFTGCWKLQDVHWRDGSALHYVMNNIQFRRFPHDLPVWTSDLLTVATYVTLLWELAFPLMVLWRPTRWIALGLGVLTHLGMLAVMELGPFPYVMLGSYVAFLDPHWVSGVPVWVRTRLWRASRLEPATSAPP